MPLRVPQASPERTYSQTAGPTQTAAPQVWRVSPPAAHETLGPGPPPACESRDSTDEAPLTGEFKGPSVVENEDCPL